MMATDFPVRVSMVREGDVTADRVIEHAILDLLSLGIERSESEIAARLLSSLTASHDEIFRDICIMKIDHLVEYGRGFGALKITQRGAERLDELIHQDMTFAARLVTNAALAEMGLTS